MHTQSMEAHERPYIKEAPSHCKNNQPSSVTDPIMENKSTTDVLMSIPPEDALEIARGRKTNLYRCYLLPATGRTAVISIDSIQ